MPAESAAGNRPVRVLRVIARLNLGGPAHHVGILSGRLGERGYRTRLVTGNVPPGEMSADEVVRGHGAAPEVVAALTPQVAPLRDLRALVALCRIVRRFGPDVVHTHTAKAGLIGRVAALAATRRPVVVHTYHGHVLEGYFGPALTAVYRNIERATARISDCLIGVSRQTVDDLVRLGVAPADRFRVVPLGLDLDPYLAVKGSDPAARAALGLAEDDVALLFVGRLVPIKSVDRLIDATAAVRARGLNVVLLVVGDGELRAALEDRARERGVASASRFLGYRTDLVPLVRAADMAVLSSDNEGTPVALIEAAAAGLPAVSTAVGGVAEVVRPDTGRLVEPPDDVARLADAIAELAADAELRRALGERARRHVQARYGSRRLVDDIDGLYRELLAAREARG